MAKKHHETNKTPHVKLVLQPIRVGVTFGIIKSICLAFLGLSAFLVGWGSAVVRLLGSVFLGYEASITGIALGLFWGFAGGFIGGYLFAHVYNYLEAFNL